MNIIYFPFPVIIHSHQQMRLPDLLGKQETPRITAILLCRAQNKTKQTLSLRVFEILLSNNKFLLLCLLEIMHILQIKITCHCFYNTFSQLISRNESPLSSVPLLCLSLGCRADHSLSGLQSSFPSDCEFLLRRYHVLFIFVLTPQCLIKECYIVIVPVIKLIPCDKHTEDKNNQNTMNSDKCFSNLSLHQNAEVGGREVGGMGCWERRAF